MDMLSLLGPAGQLGFLLMLPLFAYAMFTQFNVKRTFDKFYNVRSYRGMTGAEVARLILDRNGLYNVQVLAVSGQLTDHFDPRNNTVNLSSIVYGSNSIASIAVAAHEVGHAIQHAEGYAPIQMRSAVLPLANIGSQAMPILIFAGFIFNFGFLVNFGILFYIFAVLFHVVTLPVEFNASSRAIAQLEGGHYIDEEETISAKKVLNAAAMTYVASAAIALAQLLRLIMISKSMSDDE